MKLASNIKARIDETPIEVKALEESPDLPILYQKMIIIIIYQNR